MGQARRPDGPLWPETQLSLVILRKVIPEGNFIRRCCQYLGLMKLARKEEQAVLRTEARGHFTPGSPQLPL